MGIYRVCLGMKGRGASEFGFWAFGIWGFGL